MDSEKYEIKKRLNGNVDIISNIIYDITTDIDELNIKECLHKFVLIKKIAFESANNIIDYMGIEQKNQDDKKILLENTKNNKGNE